MGREEKDTSGPNEEDINKMISDAAFFFLVADQKKALIKVNFHNSFSFPLTFLYLQLLLSVEGRCDENVWHVWKGEEAPGSSP